MMSWRVAVSATALILAMLSTAAFATAPLEAPLWWRMPIEQEVKWRGMLPTEGGAVGMGAQIGAYPVQALLAYWLLF